MSGQNESSSCIPTAGNPDGRSREEKGNPRARAVPRPVDRLAPDLLAHDSTPFRPAALTIT